MNKKLKQKLGVKHKTRESYVMLSIQLFNNS